MLTDGADFIPEGLQQEPGEGFGWGGGETECIMSQSTPKKAPKSFPLLYKSLKTPGK